MSKFNVYQNNFLISQFSISAFSSFTMDFLIYTRIINATAEYNLFDDDFRRNRYYQAKYNNEKERKKNIEKKGKQIKINQKVNICV